MGRTLAVRLDSDGDVLLCGPALTLLAETGDEVDLLVSSQGLAAAGLLPAVSEVLVHDAPWSGFRPLPVDRAATAELAVLGLLWRFRRDALREGPDGDDDESHDGAPADVPAETSRARRDVTGTPRR